MPPDFIGNFILAFEADHHVVRRTSRFLPFELCDMRRAVAPVATDPATGDDVHVEVWRALPRDDAVVLNEIHALGVVCTDEGLGYSAGGLHDGHGLVVRQVEQSRGVTAGTNQDLAYFELLEVDHSHGLFGLLDDPLVLTSGNCLAQEAWIFWLR